MGGGWGGRFDVVDYGWIDTKDFNPSTGEDDRSYPQTRWVEEIQNDFAARADWGVADFEDANHPPEATVSEGLDHVVDPGETLILNGSATDPDDDEVSLSWWEYEEAGTMSESINLKDHGDGSLAVTVPETAKPGETIHLILDAQDNGVPALVHHQRVILTIADKSEADDPADEDDPTGEDERSDKDRPSDEGEAAKPQPGSPQYTG